MSLIEYEGYTKTGDKIAGRFHGTQAELVEELKAKNIILNKVSFASSKREKKITSKDIHRNIEELYYLLSAGLKLDDALKIIIRNTNRENISGLWQSTLKQVKEGRPLSLAMSDAFAETGTALDPLYFNIISVGEEVGNLKEALSKVLKHLTFRLKLVKEIKSSLTYPAFLLIVSLISIFFITGFILPKFSAIFTENDMHNLPFISKLILGTGNFINSNIQGVLFAAVLSAVLAVYGFSNRNIRTKLIKLLGRLPIVRNLILQTELSNVFVSLSNLLEGGVDITKAFRISSQNLENEELKSLMQLTTEGLKKGETISRNWGTSSIIPQDIIPLITVAEKTATLPEVFNNLGDRLLNQFKDTVSRFLSILEPVIIVFLGLFIGVIIVAIMLAIVSLSDVGI